MDIKILDSHLREYIHTKADPFDIAKAMSLSSASIERVEEMNGDFLYSVEITTNRPDMMSVYGLACEAAAVLPSFGFEATLEKLKLPEGKRETDLTKNAEIKVINDETLVKRIMGVVLEVRMGKSPTYIVKRLEAAGIRSLNTIIDITNYVMLEIGHPCHAFDYDRLTTKKLIIRPSKKGEKIITLDKKEHTLAGGDIVADNGEGEIVDLLGIMGTANSAVTDKTKRILFFFDNNDPWRIRKTSMGLAIRTDAAALNEKGVDPELAQVALLRGIQLYKEFAHAKVVSNIIDIYPDKPIPTTLYVSIEHIQKIIGVAVTQQQAIKILTNLGFFVEIKNSTLKVRVPSWREGDISLPEDIAEEVARMYGYHNIPESLPPFTTHAFYHQESNVFYWENLIKETLKNWGFTEVYTYSMVSETLLEGPLEQAITLSNPLDSDHVHLRTTLTPSLLAVIAENKSYEDIAIFEIANIYKKSTTEKLPQEKQTLACILKGKFGKFLHAKGVVEQLLHIMGIRNAQFTDSELGGIGASIFIGKDNVGTIEVMDKNLVTIELHFDSLITHATLKKVYKPLSKYPPVTEDIAFILPDNIKTGNVIEAIKTIDTLITHVSLLDMYEQTRTFHIVYQDPKKNLTSEEVGNIRKKIFTAIEKKIKGKVK